MKKKVKNFPFTIAHISNPVVIVVNTLSPFFRVRRLFESKSPADPFTISEPQNQEIGKFYVVQDGLGTDLEAPKLWKGRSGVLLSKAFLRIRSN